MERNRALLLRRMVLHNERPRLPKAERDRSENLKAVRMLTLIGCLDYALIGLVDSASDEGLLVRNVKRNLNKAKDCVGCMHREVFELIRNSSDVAGRIFSDLRDKNWWSIDDHVKLGGVEGAYNIVVSLCRLIDECNRQISVRYNYRTVKKVKYVADLISVLGVEDKHLDFIIDKAVIVR